MRNLVLLRMVASPLQLPPLTVCCAWFSSCTASASSTHGQLCMVQQFHLFSFTSSASSTHGLLRLFSVRHFSFLHARSAAPLRRPSLQLPPRTVCCASSASATSASSTHGLLLMDTSSLPGPGIHDHVDPQPRPRRVCPRLKLMMMMLVTRLARDQSSKGHTVLYAARPQGRNKKPPTRKEPQNTQQFTLRGRYIRRHCAVRMSSFKLVVNASRKRRL